MEINREVVAEVFPHLQSAKSVASFDGAIFTRVIKCQSDLLWAGCPLWNCIQGIWW